MTLDRELRQWKEVPDSEVQLRFRPALSSFSTFQVIEDYTERFIIPEEGFVLHPGRFVLGWTAEKLQLPYRSRIAARVEGKSSLARLGLGIHVTAPTVHAGFGSKLDDDSYLGTQLQLEIWNVGKVPVVLDPGMAICQLIFEFVDGTPEMGYEGQFANQGPLLNSGPSA
ncbi:MAG: 2'-deoxycytidine 5'-triphosphate deaminase [Gemmataceae bacterium]|nr:2'-deoxycytidine 5'-triphosphate deaminase [Gemmataceae bacterium]